MKNEMWSFVNSPTVRSLKCQFSNSLFCTDFLHNIQQNIRIFSQNKTSNSLLYEVIIFHYYGNICRCRNLAFFPGCCLSPRYLKIRHANTPRKHWRVHQREEIWCHNHGKLYVLLFSIYFELPTLFTFSLLFLFEVVIC